MQWWIIPALQTLLDDQKSGPNTKDSRNRISMLEAAISGWKGALQRVIKLHEDAVNYDTARAVEVTKIYDSGTKFDGSSASLVPPSLLKGAPSFAPVSAIGFGGGGGALVFTEVIESEKTVTKATGFHFSFDARAWFDVDIAVVSIGPVLAGDVGALYQHDDETDDGVTTGTASSRQFSLSDPENGDEFEVAVCTLFFRFEDPKLIFFVAVSGSCVQDRILCDQEWTKSVQLGKRHCTP